VISPHNLFIIKRKERNWGKEASLLCVRDGIPSKKSLDPSGEKGFPVQKEKGKRVGRKGFLSLKEGKSLRVLLRQREGEEGGSGGGSSSLSQRGEKKKEFIAYQERKGKRK